MNRRLLGNTGISVSEIAFGGVEIGMPYGRGVSTQDMLSESDAVRLLHNALDSGIDFFDTARMYGDSETIMGKAFDGIREKVVLATKCRHLKNSGGELPDEGLLKKIIADSLHESLNALRTDYIDVFMLHQADIEILNNPTIAEVFLHLKEDGVIRATGVSTYTPEETAMVVDRRCWDVVQLPFNIMDQRQETYFDRAMQNGVGVVIRSVLFRGLLTEHGKDLHPALGDVEKHIRNLVTFAEGRFPSLPVMATKFALSFGNVSSVLVGLDKPEYLDKAVATADGVYMDATVREAIKRLAYPEPEFLNLPHWERSGWLNS